MAFLNDPREMKMIYDVSKLVYAGEFTPSLGCNLLYGKVNATESSIMMYFRIYLSMRKGICYKMGTSAAFTQFMIESIYADFGLEAMLIALSAAKQNADYRDSCNNSQPGIKEACLKIINKYNLDIKYDDLNQYYGKGEKEMKDDKEIIVGKTNTTTSQIGKDYLKLRIEIGMIVFEAEGKADIVKQQEQDFANVILPGAIATLEGIYKKQKKVKASTRSKSITKEKAKTKGSKLSTGTKIKKRNKNIESLKSKFDFKAKMIPLLYLANEYKYQKDFSIREIQDIMKDAIGEKANTNQIEDVFTRRADWFELTSVSPKRYKLLDTAVDYAKDILEL